MIFELAYFVLHKILLLLLILVSFIYLFFSCNLRYTGWRSIGKGIESFSCVMHANQTLLGIERTKKKIKVKLQNKYLVLGYILSYRKMCYFLVVVVYNIRIFHCFALQTHVLALYKRNLINTRITHLFAR